MKQQHTDILIIGIGLAGMTAAITAAKSGKLDMYILHSLHYLKLIRAQKEFILKMKKNLKNLF